MGKQKELEIDVKYDADFIGKLSDSCAQKFFAELKSSFKKRENDIVTVDGKSYARAELQNLLGGTVVNRLPDFIQFQSFGVFRISDDKGEEKEEIVSFDHQDKILRVYRHEDFILQQRYDNILRAYRVANNEDQVTIQLKDTAMMVTCQTSFERDEICALVDNIVSGRVPEASTTAFPKCLFHGWVEKKGKSKWAKRYMFMTPSSLFLFRDPDSLVPLQIISSFQYSNTQKTDTTKNGFQVFSNSRDYFFRVELESEKDRWLNLLNNACKSDFIKLKEKKDLEAQKDDIFAPIVSEIPAHQKSQKADKINRTLDHILELDKLPARGTVYACGRLMNNRSQVYPLIVEGLRSDSIRWVSSGPEHVAVVSDDFNVYTWGKGFHGRLGHGTEREEVHPRLVQILQGKNVIQVVCGGMHTAALTVEGEIYMWGAGNQGQLGLGFWRDAHVPTLLDTLEDVKFKQVSLGYAHSAALSMAGQVFTWGNGEFGQLGHGNKNDLTKPALVEALEHEVVRYITCGFRHMMAITEDGRVYCWGVGTDGQMGTGHNSGQSVPILVQHLVGIPIIFGSCGKYHTAVVSDAGQVYIWGKSTLVGHDNAQLAPFPTKLNIPEVVLFVFCGYEHTVAITVDCQMYSWGKGLNGRLGHGDEFDMPQPRQVQKFATLTGRRRLHSAHLGAEFTVTLVGCRDSALLPPRAPWSVATPEEKYTDYDTYVASLSEQPVKPNPYGLGPNAAAYPEAYSIEEELQGGVEEGLYGFNDDARKHLEYSDAPEGMNPANLYGAGAGDFSFGAIGANSGTEAGGVGSKTGEEGVSGLVGGMAATSINPTAQKGTGKLFPFSDPRATAILGCRLPDIPCGFGVVGQGIQNRFDCRGEEVIVGVDGYFYDSQGNILEANTPLFDEWGRMLDPGTGFQTILQHDPNMQPLILGVDGLYYDQNFQYVPPYAPRFDSMGLPMVSEIEKLGPSGLGVAAALPRMVPYMHQLDIQGKKLPPGVQQAYDENGRPILRHPLGHLVDADGKVVHPKTPRFNAIGLQLDPLNRILPFGAVPMFDAKGNAVCVGIDNKLYTMDGAEVVTGTQLFDAQGNPISPAAIEAAYKATPFFQALAVIGGFSPEFLSPSNLNQFKTADPGTTLDNKSGKGVNAGGAASNIPNFAAVLMSVGSDPFGRPLTFGEGVLFSMEGVPFIPASSGTAMPAGAGAGTTPGAGGAGAGTSGIGGASMMSPFSNLIITNFNPVALAARVPAGYGQQRKTQTNNSDQTLVTTSVTSSAAPVPSRQVAESLVQSVMVTSAESVASPDEEVLKRMKACLIRPGVYQLNLVLENDPEPLGFIEIDANATLEEVRSAIRAEIPDIPDFRFVLRGSPFSATQEKRKVASEFLPNIQLRPISVKGEEPNSGAEKFKLALKGRKITAKVRRMIEEEEKAKNDQAQFAAIMAKIRSGQYLRPTSVRK